MVIFIPFWRTEIGKSGEGIDVLKIAKLWHCACFFHSKVPLLDKPSEKCTATGGIGLQLPESAMRISGKSMMQPGTAANISFMVSLPALSGLNSSTITSSLDIQEGARWPCIPKLELHVAFMTSWLNLIVSCANTHPWDFHNSAGLPTILAQRHP